MSWKTSTTHHANAQRYAAGETCTSHAVRPHDLARSRVISRDLGGRGLELSIVDDVAQRADRYAEERGERARVGPVSAVEVVVEDRDGDRCARAEDDDGLDVGEREDLTGGVARWEV